MFWSSGIERRTANEREAMSSSVFEHLAKRFSKCQSEIRRGKTESDWDISDVMFTAGRTLFAAISSDDIDLGDISSWFRNEPKGIRTCDDGKGGEKDVEVYSWDLYWLSAIRWLDANKPNSGITFSVYMQRRRPEDYLYIGKNVWSFLFTLLQLRDKDLKKAWGQLATASEEGCLYLDRILAGGPEQAVKGDDMELSSEHEKGADVPPPIDTEGLWNTKSLKKLREIDSRANRNGIAGDKETLKRLKEYLTRHRKRKDIANTLYHVDGQVKTKMPYRSMFK